MLGVHRNSVLYRLQRVNELIGADLDDGDTRLLLQLVMRSIDFNDDQLGAESVDFPPPLEPRHDADGVVWLRRSPVGSEFLELADRSEATAPRLQSGSPNAAEQTPRPAGRRT